METVIPKLPPGDAEIAQIVVPGLQQLSLTGKVAVLEWLAGIVIDDPSIDDTDIPTLPDLSDFWAETPGGSDRPEPSAETLIQ